MIGSTTDAKHAPGERTSLNVRALSGRLASKPHAPGEIR